MYTISQLNDLLVPELLDIAEQLDIPGSKKMHKQDLIDTIIEKQSQMAEEKKTGDGDKPKRKRIPKGATGAAEPEKKEPVKAKKAEPEKKPVKKVKQDVEEEDEEHDCQYQDRCCRCGNTGGDIVPTVGG